MARIKLDVPDTIHYSTEIPVRISDINYGNHLGNDSLLSMMHEARVRLLTAFGYTEMNIESSSIIMNDVAIVYKAEALYGDLLRFDMSVVDFHRFGCDIFYKVTIAGSRKEVARAKTGIIFFDYAEKKMREVPPAFRLRFT